MSCRDQSCTATVVIGRNRPILDLDVRSAYASAGRRGQPGNLPAWSFLIWCQRDCRSERLCTTRPRPTGSAIWERPKPSPPTCVTRAALDGVDAVFHITEPDDALAGLLPGAMRDGPVAMFADYTAHGFHGGNNLVLQTILGRTPEPSTAI